MKQIPQCDPHASYLAQRQPIDEAVLRVLAGGRYILGPEVTRFEQEFADFIGATHGLGVANGTDALALALRAAGVGPGDLVVTVSHTAVATAVAIRSIGASPLFVDVDDTFGLMDPAELESLLTLSKRGDIPVDYARIRAVVPVHLYGCCADMAAICRIAGEHGLLVVEDCAQAHGASLSGRTAGTWGIASSFSFYPTKNLGAFGDGGAIVSMDGQLMERARLLREYGWKTRYVSAIEGGNSRLDEMQAAILLVKLARLGAGNSRRQALADLYRARIVNPYIRMPQSTRPEQHVYHQFVLRCEQRDGLRAALANKGVGTLVHYPCPIHLQPAYAAEQFSPMPLPRTESWATQVLSLPIFPELAEADAEAVSEAVNSWRPEVL